VRFYYPVFAVLFLDFGLSVGQFAVLNAIWAATIVLCEVPSGALADAVGRRALVVASGLGLLPVVLLHAVMLLTGFLVSHYLNAITDSTQRATVLSFKGLVFNLGYGALGLLYAGLLVLLREQAGSPASEMAVFQASLPWLLGYGIMACLLFVAFVATRLPVGGLKRLDDG